MSEENPDVQIVVNSKVKAERYFIHVAREFPDEASAIAHFEHMMQVIDIEGSHMVVFHANVKGKEVVVLFLEPLYDTEADQQHATTELCTAGKPISLPPASARQLGEMIIEASE